MARLGEILLMNVVMTVVTAVVLGGCAGPDGPAAADDDVQPDAGVDPPPAPSGFALPLEAPTPVDNPATPAKIALGRLLFWDPILSGNGDTACASCHDPRTGYSDGLRTAIGTTDASLTPPNRNSQTILNTAWNGAVASNLIPSCEQAPMFWDSRAHSLELQARGPLTAAAEMMGSTYTETTIFPEVLSRLSTIPAYVTQFEAVFGAGPITEANLEKAIAAFERTLTNPQTSYDRYVAGELTALTPQQKRGLDVFTQIGCPKCHGGPMFSDYKLHTLRVPDLPGAPHDAGDGSNRFRTPSLRNITHTAPYMHDGVFPGLPQVFQFYRNATQNPVDPDLRGVRTPTPQEAPDVEAFLGALGDAPFDASIPAAVPSGMTPGGAR